MSKVWEIKSCDEKDIKKLADGLGISLILARVLWNRGIREVEEAKEFLEPDLTGLLDPFGMADMEKAVDRIQGAIKAGQRILIYGDYDVDGVTGTAFLLKFLNSMGAQVRYYIPHRVQEGYGLHERVIKKAAELGIRLIITVDCGIGAFGEVELAKRLGMDVIITDHHQIGDEIPAALAVLNPKRYDCTYPFKELAGVGVVYKLVKALDPDLGSEFLDLVAIGTIGDVVPLLGENRVMVKEGLKRLAKTSNLGLRELLKVVGLENREIDSYHVGFIIAPRLNAAGRIEDARYAVRLLITADEGRARRWAEYLDKKNNERQTKEEEILGEACSKLEEQVDLAREKVIVLAAVGWHPGVIGIVASRLVELYNRPTIMVAIEGDKARGSGRSIPEFNIFEALGECADLLLSYGGHRLAVGLTLEAGKVRLLRQRINEVADTLLPWEAVVSKIVADAGLGAAEISFWLTKDLLRLAPFGYGNPTPVFVSENLIIMDVGRVGDEEKHLKLKLKGDRGFPIDCIGAGMGDLYDKFSVGQRVDICFSLSLDEWEGLQAARVNLKDLKAG